MEVSLQITALSWHGFGPCHNGHIPQAVVKVGYVVPLFLKKVSWFVAGLNCGSTVRWLLPPQSRSTPFFSAPVFLQGMGTERVERYEPLNIPGDFGCGPHWTYFPSHLRREGEKATVILCMFSPFAFRSLSFTGAIGSDLFFSRRHSITPDSEHSEC